MTIARHYQPILNRLRQSLKNWTDEELLLARQAVLQAKESTAGTFIMLQTLDTLLHRELSRRLLEILELERLYFRR